MSLTLTKSQSDAVANAVAYANDPSSVTTNRSGFYSIGGYAGTGKTTLIKFLLEALSDKIAGVCSYTGKAASVLQKKGVSKATTIHRKIYAWDDIEETFYRKPKSEFPYHILIIDEASMVSAEIFEDLRSYGVPIIAVGDPGQLPPISDNDLNLVEDPDYLLDEIHRQSSDNPIVSFAHHVRQAKDWLTLDDILSYDSPDESRLRITNNLDEEFWDSDVILTSLNKLRIKFNEVKRQFLGYTNPLVEHERIIFIQNNERLGVFNGQTASIVSLRESSYQPNAYFANLLFDDGTRREVPVTTAFLNQHNLNWRETRSWRDYGIIDYGYCLTAHKAQGSEWDTVSVYRIPLNFDGWDQQRWDYTAITRAANKLIFAV